MAVIFSFSIYPDFLQGFFVDRGTEAINKLSYTYFIENIYSNIKICVKFFGHYIYSYLGILIISACIIYKSIITKNLLFFFTRIDFLIFISCLFWAVAVIHIAPYKIPRYIVSITPLVITMSFFIIPQKIYLLFILSICITSTNFYGIPFIKSNVEKIYTNNIFVIYDNFYTLHTIPLFIKNNKSIISVDSSSNITQYTKDDIEKFDTILIENDTKQKFNNLIDEYKFRKHTDSIQGLTHYERIK